MQDKYSTRKDEYSTNLLLNSGDGQVNFITSKMKGFLDSVIIDSPTMTEIIVKSVKGYLLLHVYNHEGIIYYAPRVIVQGPERNLFVNDQFDKFLLDEEIEITVRTLKDTDVNVIIRIS